MNIKYNAELPFRWCELCDRIELETEEIIADGKVHESRQRCRNASICAAMERAMWRELKRQSYAEISESLEGYEIGKKLGAGLEKGSQEIDKDLADRVARRTEEMLRSTGQKSVLL